MKISMNLLVVVLAGVAGALDVASARQLVEPAPRVPTRLPFQFPARASVTAVAELPDGRIVVSDKAGLAVAILDPATGRATNVASAGLGAGRVAEPGGLYGGAGRPLLLLDQGQMRAITIAADGTLGSMTPYAAAGTSASTSGDRDAYLLDGSGRSYALDAGSRMRSLASGTKPPTADLVRFDAATQSTHVVARLRQRESRVIPGGDGMTYTRAVVGSPEDGWGVASDGRVAVVRAEPYRVDWYSTTGVETQGPVQTVSVIPFTQADRDEFIQRHRGGSVGVGATGAPADGAGSGYTFADNKAPFDAEHVVVSAHGRVWVLRQQPAGHSGVVYDVFDGRGRRVDRLVMPAGSRVVGSGTGVVYVRQPSTGGVIVVKYEVK